MGITHVEERSVPVRMFYPVSEWILVLVLPLILNELTLPGRLITKGLTHQG